MSEITDWLLSIPEFKEARMEGVEAYEQGDPNQMDKECETLVGR